jgi:uncharacterized protein YndB with AHSA1/START domain
VDEIVVSTDVFLPPEEVYEFLVDFPRYAKYSEYLTDVTRDGDGSVGTRYALRFSWWKLRYTAHAEVTDLDPPNRIEWRVVSNLHAHGHWAVDRLDSLPADAPDDADVASRVTFAVAFDADSVRGGALDLPTFVSLDWVIDRVRPKVVDEAERVVERIVADLEGRHRPVELRVREGPDTV